MSYFDFFCNNVRNNEKTNACGDDVFVKGSCYSMCPQEEAIMREKARLVHILEVHGNKKKLIKCFSRSAADSNMAMPKLLRPYATLYDTVQYLLLEVTKRNDVPETVLYDFITDRLRAVRQDMTIQRLPPDECIVLLEPMVRFHVYYGYKLCEYSLNNYDPVLNKKLLLECIKWYLNCCDMLQDNAVDKLARILSNFGLESQTLPNERTLMENLYIICNLNDLHPLFRYLKLPKDIKSAPSLNLAYELAVSNLRGNFVGVIKLSKKLSPLCFCAFSIQLPEIQRQALRVLSTSYNSKHLSVPLTALQHWFGFSSESDVSHACRHYGLQVNNNAVKFLRGDFNNEITALPPKVTKQFKIQDIFTNYNKAE